MEAVLRRVMGRDQCARHVDPTKLGYNISSLEIAKEFNNMLPQPPSPSTRLRSSTYNMRQRTGVGGSDKSKQRLPRTTPPVRQRHDRRGHVVPDHPLRARQARRFFEKVSRASTASSCAATPGRSRRTAGRRRSSTTACARCKKMGIQVWPSPDVMEFRWAPRTR